MFALEQLLNPISEERPCGESCEYETDFLELLEKATARQVNDAWEDPKWSQVNELALAVFSKSKHLRTAVILTLCGMQLEGFPGLTEGLSLIKELLARYWESVHPQLDDGDATERMNTLSELAAFEVPYRFRIKLKELPICTTPLGRISLNDIENASTRTEGAETTGPTTHDIEIAFREAAQEELQQIHDSAGKALITIRDIDKLLMDKVEAGDVVNLSELTKVLEHIRSEVGKHLAGEKTEGSPEEPGTPAEQPTGQAPSAGRGFSGGISSQNDVLNALDEICKYYQSKEPSSPVPYLLKRARRMVKMDFMEIVNELTPDSLTQVKVITGSEEGSSES